MAVDKIKLPANLSVLALFGLVLLLLQLMSSATQEASEFSGIYNWLLLINGIGSIVLLVLVGANIYTLMLQLKKHEAGSKLTIRMVFLFVVLALSPAAIVFYFSMQFLHQGIDSWFNVEIDRAMEDSLELSQSSLEQRIRWHLKQTKQAAESLEMASEQLASLKLENLRELSDAAEMTVFSRPERIIASSSVTPSEIVPHMPDRNTWLQLHQNHEFAALTPEREGQLMIRVIVPINNETPLYLQAMFAVPVRIADLADSVEFEFIRYQELNYLRNSLKISFSLALSLVLLMSMLAAIWVSFLSIRNIIAPVKALVKGTQAVASGQYDQQLPVTSHDDLGFLVESFNEMTLRISKASYESRVAGQEVENQRAYLETILANLTAGVVSFDADNKIRTANQAAYRVFRTPVGQFIGHTLPELATRYAELSEPLKSMHRLMEQAEDIWQQRIAFLGSKGRQELLCRGSPLFSQSGQRIGAVIVFDDVTDLIQAQKNAAWGEVARRLAHEIKNPLTPIQLSAERLQRRLSGQLPAEYADILQRSTKTIVQQVEAMKEMVDDFSQYAKSPKKNNVTIDLPELINGVLALYAIKSGITIRTQFAPEPLVIQGDPVSLRQLLHNMIKNALEAIGGKGNIDIKVHRLQKNNTDFIEMALIDDGPGIKEEQIEQIFEPYVTTKDKGTGLGLAIVKKIVEEHGGAIWVDANRSQGAGFILQLPVSHFTKSI